MSQELIRQAFETRLQTWATAQGLDVAWENTDFEPETDQAYVRPTLLPAPTAQLFLDQTGRSYRGIFQVLLNMPLGTGPGTGEALVASLDASFAGTFTQGSITVTLISPMCAAPALPSSDRYVIPVSAAYRVVTVV